MANLDGNELHHAVACRILARYLASTGCSDVRLVESEDDGGRDIDIEAILGGAALRVKAKADSYCGTDPVKIADRTLPFYRRQGTDYAFEAVSHSVTRRPGWIFLSEATDLHYYFLALEQSAADVAALLQEPDDVFFGELKVERDDLHVIAMEPLRRWFEAHYEEYTPRPVLLGDHSAWFRLVPRDVLRRAVPVRAVGPVFGALSRL
jgi:hypothetical protein